MVIRGKGVSTGVAIGPLFRVKKDSHVIKRQQVDDTDAEFARFLNARSKAAVELGELAVRAAVSVGKENSLLFEIHKMMLEDTDYQESIENKIKGEKLCAEYAVQETAKEFSKTFANMDNEYMKSRAIDVLDVSNQVINILLGRENSALALNIPGILFAEYFTPSETAQFDRNKVLALLTENGSDNSHTAIFARTMGIPSIVGIGKELEDIPDGTQVGLDGESGVVYIRPSDEILDELRKKQSKLLNEKQMYERLIGKATQTQSGRRVKLYANIGSLSDIEAVLHNDAEGVGLLRSEFLYLESNNFPSEQQLFEVYRTIAEKMEGRQVIIRTLDIGADKQVSYFHLTHEENPAMGMRAIRICLTQPDIFKTQLRAILRSSAYGNIGIMFPMIASLSEVQQAKQWLATVKQELDSENVSYDTKIPVGIMIETPASAIISDVLAKEVDFFSLGTNDLTQYTLAVDRQNETLSNFCDPHHLAILRLIEMTIKNAKKSGIWVGICGELAADTEMTKALLDMGIDELSVSPSKVLPLRQFIRGIN